MRVGMCGIRSAKRQELNHRGYGEHREVEVQVQVQVQIQIQIKSPTLSQKRDKGGAPAIGNLGMVRKEKPGLAPRLMVSVPWLEIEQIELSPGNLMWT
jgi:hypothetical protein